LTYVLLLGAGNWDYKGIYGDLYGPGFSSMNYLPSYLTFTEHAGETVTDEWFARVSGDDPIPDIHIGRLPAQGPDEGEVMVRKIIDYETSANTKTWEKHALLVSDNETEAYEVIFEAMNEEIAALLPQDMSAPFRGYLDDYFFVGDLNDDLMAELDAGALLVHYSGHGSNQIWAHENIFENADVGDLSNNERLPFVVSMSCLTGYFAYPEAWSFPSMAEVLLNSQGKGAVAAFMPTGMTEPEGQHIMDQALFEAVFTEDTRTLGPAVSQAKQTLLANGAEYEEVSETFLLFGDPAMSLKVPIPTMPLNLVIQEQNGNALLSWEGATDCNGGEVAGYNIYRSTDARDSYEKLNTTPITETYYLDSSCERGATYHYIVTSVDSDGDESPKTPQMSVAIPPLGGNGGSLRAMPWIYLLLLDE
jgi:hypothetical protein